MMIDFNSALQLSPNPYMVLDTDLNIVWANQAYLRVTDRELDEIRDRPLFEAFPSEGESFHQLKRSFEKVLATGKSDEIAYIPYAIPTAEGGVELHVWSATHIPLYDGDGVLSHILQHTVRVTDLDNVSAAGVLRRAQAVQRQYLGASRELERLHNLVEQAPGFVAVLMGAKHRFIMANAAYRRLIGERPLIGRTVATAIPEVADQGFIDVLDAVHQTGQPYLGRREEVRLKSEGEDELVLRHLEFIFQPIHGRDGIDGILIQGHDITDQIQAEERQQILINELNHRVKNSLAVVQGLALQSFRDDRANPSLQVFSERLSALAGAHNLLTEKRWESADLKDIVTASLVATAGTERSRYSLDGPQIELRSQPALALSMIIHELSTNAVKYGAFSTEEGSVAITWSVARDDKGRHLTLDWEESGGPPVIQPDRRGFGSRLIARGLGTPGSLAEMTYHPAGLHCRIRGTI
ncbi:sensor histidine kinase [Qipengyuania sp.]|uniref:sensor histidine kinase n=1 Tax=Qipengyuania sp. TaxID=2004515 RepID=UPI00373632E6